MDPGAEIACAYVAERVRREAPRRWIQGPRRPALDAGEGASEVLHLFATRDLYRLPRAVSEALVAWARGRRRVLVLSSLPTPHEVLAMQPGGRGGAPLLADADVPAGPIAGLPRREGAYGSGGLAFAVHDLCHLEKFFAPAHHVEQVGFFAALSRALADPAWAALEEGFDETWRHDRDHVLADMNGASAFLFVVLRNKVKLAVRRRVALARGAPCGTGALDGDEARAYADAVEVLVAALGLSGEARGGGAAPRVAARGGGGGGAAAHILRGEGSRGGLHRPRSFVGGLVGGLVGGRPELSCGAARHRGVPCLPSCGWYHRRMLSSTSLRLARLAALASLVALPALLLASACSSQCSAACVPGVTITVRGSANAVLGASSTYVLTIANDGLGAGSVTCTSSVTGAFSCTGGTGDVSLTPGNGGELTANLVNMAPTSLDLVLTRDGTTVVNANVMPDYAMNDVCGEQCQEGTVSVYAQQ